MRRALYNHSVGYKVCLLALALFVVLTLVPVMDAQAATDGVNVNLTVTSSRGGGTTTPTTSSPGGGGGGSQSPYPTLSNPGDGTPPTVIDFTITAITSVSAEAHILTDEVANVLIRYGLSETLELPTKANSNFTRSHNILLSDLTPDTRYYVQARSGDPYGNIVTTAISSFRTLPLTIAVSPTPNTTAFQAKPEVNHVVLDWDLPSEPFDAVIIRKSTESYPTTPAAGEPVFEGIAATTVDDNVQTDTDYYYTLFIRDSEGRFSSGVIAYARVSEKPGVQSDGPLAVAPGRTSLITPDKLDLGVLVALVNGPLLLKPERRNATITRADDQEFIDPAHRVETEQQLAITAHAQFDLLINTESIRAAVASVVAVFNNTTYLLASLDGGLHYSASITAPGLRGRYPMEVTTTFADGSTLTKTVVVLIDPYGYVYELTPQGEQRLQDATVTLYVFDVSTQQWTVWPASIYNQDNPQATKATGEFAFFVPKGRYYLEAQKVGYISARTAEFEVIDEIVNVNIELKPLAQFTGQLGSIQVNVIGLWIGLGIIALALVLLFVATTVRRHTLEQERRNIAFRH